MSGTDATLEALRGRLQAQLAKTPRVAPWWVWALSNAGFNIVVAGASLLLMPMNDATGEQPMLHTATAALLLALVAAATWFAFKPGPSTMRFVALTASVMSLGLVVVSGSGGAPQGPFMAGIACTGFETVLAFAPLAAGLALLSRFAFDPVRAVLVGAAAATVGIFTFHLHCPNGTVSHIAVFHVAPWFALTATALAVRRLLPSNTYAP